jgi:hypothetical protein
MDPEILKYIEFYIKEIPEPKTEPEIIKAYIILSDKLFKNISNSRMSSENKKMVIMISNDLKYLTNESINDKNVGISIYAKTIPVISNLYKYMSTLDIKNEQVIAQYSLETIETIELNVFLLTVKESDFLEGVDKLNKKIPKSLPVEVQNKLREFGLDYKNAVLSKPVLKGNSNLLIIIIILLILIGLGFFYFKSKSKVSFGKRRRRV